MAPLLSIVTVVKDDSSGFESTLHSLRQLLNTHQSEVEWIVVDSSLDRNAIPSHIKDIDTALTYSWTEPHGVFAAMNAGIAQASGTYLYFLNAGDTLASHGVLERALDRLRRDQPTWLYGQVAFIDATGRPTVPSPFDYEKERRALFSRGRFPPHQGTIVNREVVEEMGGFDTTYRICADYTLALGLSLRATPIEIHDVLANFPTGGLSDRQWRKSIGEFHRARREIFRPKGFRSLQELLRTAKQFLHLSLSRLLR